MEWGMWNQECGMRNSEPFQMSPVGGYCTVLYFFVSRSSIRITIIISSLTLQDIEQHVSETLADQGIKEPPSSLAFCCYSNVSSAVG